MSFRPAQAVRALALLALLGGCAQSFAVAPPLDAGPSLQPGFMVTTDGLRLPLRRWKPDGEPRAVVVALHGFNDYSHAFEDLGRILARHGITIYAYDQRGFGAAPLRSFWPGTEPLVGDFATAVRLARTEHPGKRIVCLGESMGAAVVMTALARHGPERPACDAALLSAPAIWGRQTMPAVARVALSFADELLPSYVATGRGLKVKPSDNVAMLRGLQRDPLVLKGARIDTLAGLVDLMSAGFAAVPRLDVPLLWLYGGRDVIIPRKAMEAALARLPADDPDLRIGWYANGYHMLFRDLEGAAVAADMAAWILDPAAPLPSGADRRAGEVLAGLARRGG